MHASSHGASPADDNEKADFRPYLTSYRALAACTREFARLTTAVERRAATLTLETGDKPDVRLSPDRCVVQLGPVALTLGWLRNTLDSVEQGELLVIVWQGSVARRGAYDPERPAPTSPRVATALWEETFSATGRDEASWLWKPARVDVGGYSSMELADRCVEHLHRAYVEASGER